MKTIKGFEKYVCENCGFETLKSAEICKCELCNKNDICSHCKYVFSDTLDCHEFEDAKDIILSIFDKKNIGACVCYDCNELLRNKTMEMLKKHDKEYEDMIENFLTKKSNAPDTKKLFVTVKIFQGVLDDVRIYETNESALIERDKWLDEADIKDAESEESAAEDGITFNIFECEIEH